MRASEHTTEAVRRWHAAIVTTWSGWRSNRERKGGGEQGACGCATTVDRCSRESRRWCPAGGPAAAGSSVRGDGRGPPPRSSPVPGEVVLRRRLPRNARSRHPPRHQEVVDEKRNTTIARAVQQHRRRPRRPEHRAPNGPHLNAPHRQANEAKRDREAARPHTNRPRRSTASPGTGEDLGGGPRPSPRRLEPAATRNPHQSTTACSRESSDRQ